LCKGSHLKMNGYPINYNFALYWQHTIVPLLDHPDVLKAIQRCAITYIKARGLNRLYHPDTPLASYTSSDCYYTLMEQKAEKYLKRIELPPRHAELRAMMESDDNDALEEFLELEEQLSEPIRQWSNIKYNIESYYLIGACHWYAPTVMLTLARLVDPKEKWIVRYGMHHTTVINRSETRVFDLIYWGLDGRLRNYLFGDEIEEHDITLGGKGAFVNSTERRPK
jgi:hypothetical protein